MPRPVVTAVCYRFREGQIEFLLVRTKGGKYWTFPKGHVEVDETPWQAALREADEEAGVSGQIQQKPFTSYVYLKDERPEAVDAYLMAVHSESGSHEPDRNPQWFSPNNAVNKLAEGRRDDSAREHERVIQEALSTIQTGS